MIGNPNNKLRHDSTIRYEVVDRSSPLVCRAVTVRDKTGSMVFHLPSQPNIDAINIDPDDMSGNAIFRNSEGEKGVTVHGVWEWDNPFEVQILLPDSYDKANSFLDCVGGINKYLCVVNEDNISLKVGGVKIDLVYDGKWCIDYLEKDNEDMNIDMVDNCLKSGQRQMITVGYDEYFGDVHVID